MSLRLCYIKEDYFKKNAHFQKMLDIGDTSKQSRRTHLMIAVDVCEHNFYIPLRNHLGDPVRKFGRIGHPVPSDKRKEAGLDYRYAILAEQKYIEDQVEQKIPNSQYRIIMNDYNVICKDFASYVKGFQKAIKKNRIEKEPLYRESSLINFVHELEK